jgi:transketolase
VRKQFRDTLMELAAVDERIVLVFGDISVYLFNEFREKYPDRFFNMGICESTLISVSAGLSSQGFIPFVHSIAPFITERSFEQIKIDLSYNRFGANIVSCGASFDYAWDGPTHQTLTEMAMLTMLPNIEVLQPGSKKETDLLLKSQYQNGQTTYFRLSDQPHTIDLPVEFGKGVLLKDAGSKVTVVTAGPILGNVMEACGKLNVNVLYFHTLKPIDKELILRFKHTKFLVVHDAYGLHEAVCSVPDLSVAFCGPRDTFCLWYGQVQDVRKMLGLDP